MRNKQKIKLLIPIKKKKKVWCSFKLEPELEMAEKKRDRIFDKRKALNKR